MLVPGGAYLSASLAAGGAYLSAPLVSFQRGMAKSPAAGRRDTARG